MYNFHESELQCANVRNQFPTHFFQFCLKWDFYTLIKYSYNDNFTLDKLFLG